PALPCGPPARRANRRPRPPQRGHRRRQPVPGPPLRVLHQEEVLPPVEGLLPERGGDTCHVAPQGARCHAAFSGDLAPALLALDAEVELVASRGTRRIALADLYRDDGAAHLTVGRDEVLTRILIPAHASGRASGYRKARARAAMDFPLAGVACAMTLADNGTLR